MVTSLIRFLGAIQAVAEVDAPWPPLRLIIGPPYQNDFRTAITSCLDG